MNRPHLPRDNAIATDLLAWYEKAKRDLPWRQSRDPYAIWISEIMLQQTQVETVKPYYERWLRRFPTIEALAAAPQDDVLKRWEGLGYYSRARNLQKAAQTILADHQGRFPAQHDQIVQLSGIGDYTAGAIASIAFNQPYPAVDGNVMRVLSRVENIADDIAKPAAKKVFAERAQALIPPDRAGDFNQALMELGALICVPSNPRCDRCSLTSHCEAFRLNLQSVRPVKSKKAPPRPIERTTVILRHQERLLVGRRPEAGLLGGLWETPTVEVAPGQNPLDLIHHWLTTTGFKCGPLMPIAVVPHTFTHLKLQLHVFAADLTIEPPPLADWQWLDQGALAAIAFPVVYQKAIAACESAQLPDPQLSIFAFEQSL